MRKAKGTYSSLEYASDMVGERSMLQQDMAAVERSQIVLYDTERALR